ncbi:MAG: hypothetical protein L3J87_03490, partial [Thermoplasmata archaeon]|nr:hypothetical protein [Thermoplasmata archaeon]
MNPWYLAIGIILFVLAVMLIGVEVEGENYSAQSVQWCEQHNFGAPGSCVNAYPTGTMNAVIDAMLVVLLGGAIIFLAATVVSTRPTFDWRGGVLLGAICSAILFILYLANAAPFPYGGPTPVGTELSVNFQSVD